MGALEERRERVAYAKRLGVVKPHTLKKDALEQAIAEMEAQRAAEKAKVAADPTQDGQMHDCEHGRMQDYVEGQGWVCPSECAEPAQEESVGDVVAARTATREAWLLSAAELLAPLLAQAGAASIVQKVKDGKISIGVGFPSKTIRKRMGECWASRASANGGVIHIFMSPLVDDAVEVLHFLGHELTHADDDGESGHNGHFRKVATAWGLTGKMTETEVSEELRIILKDVADELGPYPHVKLNLSGAQKKQTTRMLKVHCVDLECPYFNPETEKGYTIRTTQSWIEVGLPVCPCGAEMTVAG